MHPVTQILNPWCERRKEKLGPGEKITICIDGVPDHLTGFKDPAYHERIERLMQAFLKFAANATSTCQWTAFESLSEFLTEGSVLFLCGLI